MNKANNIDFWMPHVKCIREFLRTTGPQPAHHCLDWLKATRMTEDTARNVLAFGSLSGQLKYNRATQRWGV